MGYNLTIEGNTTYQAQDAQKKNLPRLSNDPCSQQKKLKDRNVLQFLTTFKNNFLGCFTAPPKPVVTEQTVYPFQDLPGDIQNLILGYFTGQDRRILASLSSKMNEMIYQQDMRQNLRVKDTSKITVPLYDVQHLHLCHTSITDAELKRVLPLFPNLRDLNLHHCKTLTANIFNDIPELGTLKSLDLSCCADDVREGIDAFTQKHPHMNVFKYTRDDITLHVPLTNVEFVNKKKPIQIAKIFAPVTPHTTA